MTDTITVYGASDDLIELGGDIREEFDAYRKGEVVAFSNGTLLRVRYEDTGIWRITLLSGEAHIVPAPADDEDNYSDRATITGPVKWVAFGDQVAYAPRTPRATPVIATSSPLPDSETEWQWGNWLPREQRTLKADDEADARRTQSEDGWSLRKRLPASPWIEVTS
jgi:hypothetical protein